MKILIKIILINFIFTSISTYIYAENIDLRGKIPSSIKKSKEKSATIRGYIKKKSPNIINQIPSGKLSANLRKVQLTKKKKNNGISLRGNVSTGIYNNYSGSVPLIYWENEKTGYIGSGSLIDKCGLILTNWHVVKEAKDLIIIYKPKNGESITDAVSYPAEIVLHEEDLDLAIIKVNTVPSNIKTIPIAKNYKINVGEDIHAIGHPDGHYWTYSKGIVSQIRNKYKFKYKKSNHQANVIQIQTTIDTGSSGGPLLNNKGQLIGVNSFGKNKINFAININEAVKLIKPCSKISSKKTKVKKNKKTKYKEHDHNNNGVIDTWYGDVNGNGKIDIAYIDDDENGEIEGFLVDEDENGKWEVFFSDKDSDGKPEKAFVDDDEDGKTDEIGTDTNNDGKFDKWEKA